jgi:hypothetical protein
MTSPPNIRRLLHDLTNQIGIVYGFSGLLVTEIDAGDPHKSDVEDINNAAQAALVLLEQLKAALSSEQP